MAEVTSYSFQVDSPIVRNIYDSCDNYIIDIDESQKKEYCVLYFSSHNIYFPNNEESFTKRIIEKNYFEWYGNRVPYGHKHIFIRDVFKQWYLSGINATINSPEKLLELLTSLTQGYKIITVGSSAGGYAAVLYGQQLCAERIYTFNGRFEANSLLKSSCEAIAPIVFRHKDDNILSKYYDLKNFIVTAKNIYYFHSTKSPLDILQYKYIKNIGICTIEFNTDIHGVPFPKGCLSKIYYMDYKKIETLSKKIHNPIIFSIRTLGLIKTIIVIYKQLYNKYFRR